MPEYPFSQGNAINDFGQVVGTVRQSSSFSSASRTFLYSNGQMQALGTLGGAYSVGYGLNYVGQVTGFSDISTGTQHAFLYSSGQMIDLGTLGGTGGASDIGGSVGYSINDAGQVAGESYFTPNGQGLHAFLYSNGQIMDLGTLGGPNSYGYGINNAGQVTGFADRVSGSSAFLYSNGQMMDLGPFVGLAINSAGQVVGYGGTPTGAQHAFLYSNGQLQDLNDLIDPRLGITLSNARGINDQGQIVANGANRSGEGRPFLLTPIPEPSTLALFGVALLGLGAWVRRHPSVLR